MWAAIEVNEDGVPQNCILGHNRDSAIKLAISMIDRPDESEDEIREHLLENGFYTDSGWTYAVIMADES